MALPRGGVEVGYEVAKALGVPLEVLVVRKLGVPGWEELAMGAIGPGGVVVINAEAEGWVSQTDLVEAIERESKEVAIREGEYYQGQVGTGVKNKTVIVVDDGLATGSTMKAAVQVLRSQAAHSIVVGVPVGAATTCRTLAKLADRVVCLQSVGDLGAVGRWYVDFDQTTDEEVKDLLVRARTEMKAQAVIGNPDP
jgi:predicted phosphoribosyltransferase